MNDKDAALFEQMKKENRRISKGVERAVRAKAPPRKSTAERLAVTLAEMYAQGNKDVVLNVLANGRRAEVYLAARIALALDAEAGEFVSTLERRLDLGKGQR